MELEQLRVLLTRTPVALEAHPAILAYLPPDVEVMPSIDDLLARLDDVAPMTPHPLLTFDTNPHARARLPLAVCAFDPYTPQLNTVLAERYDAVKATTLSQRGLAGRIAEGAGSRSTVVVLLIDGLSYRDVRGWGYQVEPCLAAAPTITRIGFPTVVGDPHVSVRLFDMGFTERVGFSYWGRNDNALTDRLFTTIRDVHRCDTMDDVLVQLHAYLQARPRSRVFAQIVRVGLDPASHYLRDIPPIAGILVQLREAIGRLIEVLARTRRDAVLYVTSDHGILWKHEFTPQVIGNANGNPRYADWQELNRQQVPGVRCEVDGNVYFALPYPFVRRPLRRDESGVHGGISFEESITPFITIEVNP